MTAVVIRKLSARHGRTPALWNINIDIPKGKLVAIVGPNGAGKSTLLRCMVGLHKQQTGDISYFGETFAQYQSKIAYMPQRSVIDWNFPICALEVALMGRTCNRGIFARPTKADIEAAKETFQLLGLEGLEDRHISELSGGQQQKLFFARTLLQRAEILILDEPFAAIDFATEKLLVQILQKLQKEGKTIIVVHHDLSTIHQIFDWVILLNRVAISSGTPTEALTATHLEKAYGHSLSFLMDAIHHQKKS